MDTNMITTDSLPITHTNLTPTADCIIDRHTSIIAMKAVILVASSLSVIGALTIILVSYCKSESNDIRDKTRPMSAQSLRQGGRNDPETSSFLESSQQLPDNGHNDTMGTENRHRQWKQGIVQNPARVILVCISAADIIVAISHIWGVTNNYENVRHTSFAYNQGLNINQTAECGAQAVLAIFGAISSFLWSDVLAFMAVMMLRSSKKLRPGYFVSNRAFVVYNLICWGIPMIIVCILGGMNAVGFEEGIDVGWCYIHAHYKKQSERIWWMFFSYELWVSGSMLWILTMVVIFCIIIYAHRVKKRREKMAQNEQEQRLIEETADQDAIDERCKMCPVCRKAGCSKPVILIIAAASLIAMRIWATVLDFLLFRSVDERKEFHCSLTNPIILALAGFGNSSQGLVNFFIFIVFTGECYNIMKKGCTHCCMKSP